MSRFGTGRGRREDVLEMIERADPARHAELLELRRYNPQGYRRALRALADDYALFAPIRGGGVANDELVTPGRETDPALRVGPAPATPPDVAVTAVARAAPKRAAAAPPEKLPEVEKLPEAAPEKPAKKSRKKEG